MKPTYLTILAGGLVVALSLAVNLRLARSHHRALENIEALSEENAHLRRHIATLADSLATHHLSVPRQRLSRGELREFRPEEYRYLVACDVALRKAGFAAEYAASKVDFVASPTGYAFAKEGVDKEAGFF